MATINHPISHCSSSHLPTVRRTPATLSTAISTATSLPQLKQIHAQIIRQHLHSSNSLLFHLLLSSISFPSGFSYALSVFSSLHNPETHLCNKFFLELSRSKYPQKAIFLLQLVLNKGIFIDRFSFPPLLKAASKALALEEGKIIHGLASKFGFDSDTFVQTALVRMYGSCGQIREARLLFDKMGFRDVVTWTVMIDGYCQSGLFNDVLVLLDEMKSSNVEPDERIYSTILSACAQAGNLEYGKKFHDIISESNVVFDSYMHVALINMYASCGSINVAQKLYDELSAKHVVASTAMLSSYCKIGHIGAARSIFDHVSEKDLVCWSAMISGYAESDQPQESFKLFAEMQESGLKPDQVTMLSIISACTNLGALNLARKIHIYSNKHGFQEALSVNNALIDMYAKCGSLAGAIEVFGQMGKKNVISWTSMIGAFAMHGDAANALKLFSQMKDENVQPNWVTFVGVLYACSHAGLVEEGKTIFTSMVNEYNIISRHEHYGCMVELYGRANLLREALEVVETMPMAPNAAIWGSLLASCQIHGELELGEYAAKQLLKIDPDHDGAYAFLFNIYAKEREVRKYMQHNGIKKQPECSKIEIDSEIHEFFSADRNHKQAEEIYATLDQVVGKLKQVGYVPDISCVLIDLDEDKKREVVLQHSEKLALCYALMREDKGSCIRIIKNLRICEDCHNFMKLASKVLNREIVVRDRSRFHHYEDGFCSCKDFW